MFWVYIYTHVYINIKKTRTHSRERRCCPLSEKAQRPEKSWSRKSLPTLSYTVRKTLPIRAQMNRYFLPDRSTLLCPPRLRFGFSTCLFIVRLTHLHNALKIFPLWPGPETVCLLIKGFAIEPYGTEIIF